MALPEQESLYTIAEIAVALLGVSGLVAVFLAKGRLHPWDRAQKETLVKARIALGSEVCFRLTTAPGIADD